MFKTSGKCKYSPKFLIHNIVENDQRYQPRNNNLDSASGQARLIWLIWDNKTTQPRAFF